MEVASLGAPSTADQASSAGPSPRPRDYMDDSDCSLTRKRPRLDSGDRSYRSMSADELPATTSHCEQNGLPVAPTQDNLANFMVSTPSQTPCKVTINVRDSGHSISQLPSAEAHQPTESTVQTNQQSLPKFVEASTADDLSSPDVISVSSSPLHSPEIEIAEVEDIDDASVHTKWRTLGDAAEIQQGILEGFPYHVPQRTLREDVDLIASHIEFGELVQKKAIYWVWLLTLSKANSIPAINPSRNLAIGSMPSWRPQIRSAHNGGPCSWMTEPSGAHFLALYTY